MGVVRRTEPPCGWRQFDDSFETDSVMFRVLTFFVVIAAAAVGLMWLADNPGTIVVSWRGVEYEVSPLLALSVVLVVAIVAAVVWRGGGNAANARAGVASGLIDVRTAAPRFPAPP